MFSNGFDPTFLANHGVSAGPFMPNQLSPSQLMSLFQNGPGSHIQLGLNQPMGLGLSQPVLFSQGHSQPVPFSQGHSQPVPFSQGHSQPVPFSQGHSQPVPFSQGHSQPLSSFPNSVIIN